MSEAKISSTEAVRYGWKTTMANLRPLLVLSAIGALLALFEGALGRSAEPLAGLSRLVVQALQIGLAMLWTKAALTLHDGGKLEAPLVTGRLGGYFTYLLTWVVYVLIVAVGLVLLVVPGVIWAIELGFAGFAAVDKKLDPIEALKASRALTAGRKKQLFVFGLLLFAVNLAGALAFGIGLMVTVPTTFLAAAWMYRKLEAQAHVPFVPAAAVPQT